MVLIYLSIAWMVGIYLASRLLLPIPLWCIGTALPLAIAWLWRRQMRVRLAALIVFFALLGAIRYALAVPHFDESSVAAHNNRGQSRLVGVVVAERAEAGL